MVATRDLVVWSMQGVLLANRPNRFGDGPKIVSARLLAAAVRSRGTVAIVVRRKQRDADTITFAQCRVLDIVLR